MKWFFSSRKALKYFECCFIFHILISSGKIWICKNIHICKMHWSLLCVRLKWVFAVSYRAADDDCCTELVKIDQYEPISEVFLSQRPEKKSEWLLAFSRHTVYVGQYLQAWMEMLRCWSLTEFGFSSIFKIQIKFIVSESLVNIQFTPRHRWGDSWQQ